MNIEDLNDQEIQILLNSLKKCQKEIPDDIPLIGKIKDDTPVIDFSNKVEYILHRYRNPINIQRFSLHIRFKFTNEILIRIDINNGSHRNPDGKIISENHMHIYRQSEDYRVDAYAQPLPNSINNVSSLFSVLIEFLEYTNTKEYK